MADEAVATETAAPATQAAAPKANESFVQRMERIGGVDVFKPEPVEEATAETVTAEPAKAEKVEKPKAEKKPAASAERIEELKALATELGMTLEDGRVTSAERARLRVTSQAKAKELLELEQAATQRIEEARKTFEEELQFAQGVSAFKDSKDFQSLAKSLGYEDWNKLQDDVLAQASDPNYRRLLELEKRDKERAEAEEKSKKDAEERQRESKRIAAEQRYITGLSNEMGKSQNKLLAAFADDALFVNQVYNIQKQHYNPLTDETIEIDDALKFIPPNGKSLNSVMEGLYQKLRSVYGEQAAPATTAPAAGTGSKPKPRTDALPPPKASKPSKVDPTDRRAWMQNASGRFTQAINEDIRREANGRGSE